MDDDHDVARSDGPGLMSCPNEVIIRVIYATREGGSPRNMATLRSMSAVSITLYRLMMTHKLDIMDHFTVAFHGYSGYITHYYCGMLHRGGDMPAITLSSGDQLWYQFGQLHRDNDRPAIVRVNGSRLWYQRGQCHRDGDLPAHIDGNGSEYWYKRDCIYRNNWSPAIIHPQFD